VEGEQLEDIELTAATRRNQRSTVMSLNRAMIIGYLGQDPETRFLPSGQPVVGFSVATDESFIDKEGNKQERVEWHSIVAFARLGEICAEYLKQGRQVFVEGRLRSREYEPKNGTGKRRRTEIVASRVQFLGAPPDQETTASGTDEPLVPLGDDAPF
jgi:single-strand DNA-binding protein